MPASSPRHGLPRLGQTYYQRGTGPATPTDAAALEGYTAVFKDTTASAAVGADVQRSAKDRVMMLVKNISGIALLPKRLVQWDTSYIGKRVNGYAETGWGTDVAGVIDEHLPAAGCPDDDMCWICVQGPTLVKNGLANDSDADTKIELNCRINALTAATSQCDTAGRIQQFATTTSYTTAATENVAKSLGIIGRALSAKTSAQTDSDTLVWIDLLKA